MTLRVVFMGSPEFAVPVLRALHERFQVVGVVTQKDKPKGRGRKTAPVPVKTAALELGLPVLNPDDLLTPEVVDRLKSWAADVFVVAAYGKILPKSILDLPPMGCVNLHASLLPKYRGASPISAAILAGDRTAGVTTMLMDAGMDTGDMLLIREIPILEHDTAGSLHDRLMESGAELTVETLVQMKQGSLQPRPQDHSRATYTRLLKKEDGRLDWNRAAQDLERRIRAMNPWPGAFFDCSGEPIKVWEAAYRAGSEQPGRIAAVNEDGIAVGAGEGLLLLKQVQAPGRKTVSAAEFARGRRLKIGDTLTDAK